MSPDTDGDGTYDNDVDCLWTIEAPEDKLIGIEVLTMDIESAYRACFFDFLSVIIRTN